MPITIEKAIEILTQYMKGSDEAEPVDFDDAVLLGIEALKSLRYMRNAEHPVPPTSLPGETKGAENEH